MPSMWCFHSSRSASPPLPNNRPVGLPRPVGIRAHVLGRLTTRNTSKGSETRDVSTSNDNLQAITQAFGSSLTINAPPAETCQNVGTSQNPNLIGVPHPVGRRSRIFTRLTTRKTSKGSQHMHADATPVETSQNANSVDIPHPAERRSRIFTRLTTRNISNRSEDLQAEATSVETSYKTNLVDVPHPIKRRSHFFTRLTTRNTSKDSKDMQAEATPVETSQATDPVSKPHSNERRSRIFTRLTTRKTSKDSTDIQAEATSVKTSRNPNVPQPTGRRSRTFTRLTTHNTLNGSEHVQTEARPIETSQNQTMSVISEDIVRPDTNCPAETQSHDFGHLITRNNSKHTENTQAIRQISPLSTSIEATPVESSQNQQKSIIGEDVLHFDMSYPDGTQSLDFSHPTTQNTSEDSDNTQAMRHMSGPTLAIETTQPRSLQFDEDVVQFYMPYSTETQPHITQHHTPQNTFKGSEDTKITRQPSGPAHSVEATTSSIYSGEEAAQFDIPSPAGTHSPDFTYLATRNPFNDSEETQAMRQPSEPALSIEATPPSIHLYDMRISQYLRSGSLLSSSSSLPDLASPYANGTASTLASTLSLHFPPPAPAPPTAPNSSSPPEGVWAHFPSHDRRERSLSPAGGREGVVVRDFAPVVGGSPARAMKKPRSMGNMFRGWARRQERQMAKPPGGHRSSIAPGGLVEYPELELVAPAVPLAPAPAPQPDLSAPSAEGYAAQYADCAEEYPLGDGEADLLRGLYLAEQVALRQEVNHILAEEMALGLYEGDFI